MKRYLKGIGFYVILFFIIVMIFWMTSMPGKTSKEIYSDLVLKIQQELYLMVERLNFLD